MEREELWKHRKLWAGVCCYHLPGPPATQLLQKYLLKTKLVTQSAYIKKGTGSRGEPS